MSPGGPRAALQTELLSDTLHPRALPGHSHSTCAPPIELLGTPAPVHLSRLAPPTPSPSGWHHPHQSVGYSLGSEHQPHTGWRSGLFGRGAPLPALFLLIQLVWGGPLRARWQAGRAVGLSGALNSRTEGPDWQKLEPAPLPPHQTAAGAGHDGLGPACQELLTSLLPAWGKPGSKGPHCLDFWFGIS